MDTVSELPNSNNITQSMPIFREAISSTEARAVIGLIGEVGTGFMIWYRAQKYDASMHEMLEQALARYRLFLDEIALTAMPMCISAPLPTIRDGFFWGGMANARREVLATQVERTALTLRFDDAMRLFCERPGYDYISLDEASLGHDGIVRTDLLNTDPADHH